MAETEKPDDPYDLLQGNWPPEDSDSYFDAQVDMNVTQSASTDASTIASGDANHVGETYIGKTGSAAAEGFSGDKADLTGIATDAGTASAQLFSASTTITTTKDGMSALVTSGTAAIDAAKAAEDAGEEPPNGKSSDTLISEYRADIQTLATTYKTDMDIVANVLSGQSESAPKHQVYRAPGDLNTARKSPTELSQGNPSVDPASVYDGLQMQPASYMPPALPTEAPSNPSVPKSPSAPSAPNLPSQPSAPSMPTSPSAPSTPSTETPSTPTAPTGETSPGDTRKSSPENNPFTRGESQPSETKASTSPVHPEALADYASTAASTAADVTSTGLSGVTDAATSIAPVIQGAVIGAPQASGAPVTGAPISTMGTPGSPLPSPGLGGLGGMPPAAAQPQAQTVAGAAPAPAPQAQAPAPQGVAAQPPGTAQGQGSSVVTSQWLRDRYGVPLPGSERPDQIPALFVGMPDEAAHLHKLLATLRHSLSGSGRDAPVAIAQAFRGFESLIVYATTDGVSLQPQSALFPDGLTPLSELASPDSSRHLMGSTSVVDKLRLVTSDGWQIGQMVSTHGRESEFVQVQTPEDYADIIDCACLLPAVIERGLPDADGLRVMALFNQVSDLGIPIGDPEVLSGQLQALRWTIQQPDDYLLTYQSLMASEGYQSMTQERWNDASWAFQQAISAESKPEKGEKK